MCITLFKTDTCICTCNLHFPYVMVILFDNTQGTIDVRKNTENNFIVLTNGSYNPNYYLLFKRLHCV